MEGDEAEGLLTAVVELSDNAIVAVALDGTVTSWNAAATRLYGYSASEMVGQPMQKLAPPGATLDLGRMLQAINSGQPAINIEATRRHKDGSLVRVSLNVSPIKSRSGAIVGLASISSDLAQQDLLRQSLRDSDVRFRSLIDMTSDVILITQLDGTLSYVNAASRAGAGYDPEELIGRNYIEFVHPDDVMLTTQALSDLRRKPDEIVRLQARYRRKDGTWIYAETASRNLLNTPGINGIVVNLRDVTDRVLADKVRREGDARLTALIEHASDMIALLSRNGTIEYVSPAIEPVGGFLPSEVIGRPIMDFIHPEDQAVAAKTLSELSANPAKAMRAVWRYRHKDASWHVLEIVGRDCADVPGVGGIVLTGRDVTERRKVDQARRDSDEMLRAITRSAKDALILADNDGRIAFWNEGATALYGYSEQEAMGLDFAQVIPPEDRELARNEFQTIRETGRSSFIEKPREVFALTKRGRKVPIEIAFTPVRLKEKWNLLLIIRNITERKLAEAEREAHEEAIRQALAESMGALAATVEARDPYTAGHERRVADLSVAIARQLGFSEDRIRGLRLAAEIHDIGKISIPAEILSKPGRLSGIEIDLVQTHAQAGYEILKNVRFPWPIAEIIWQHHERLDGSGYPQGLRGEQILPEARIVAVADVAESMMQHRPYRPALGMEAALAEISGGRGTKFDAEIVDVCVKLLREQEFAFAA